MSNVNLPPAAATRILAILLAMRQLHCTTILLQGVCEKLTGTVCHCEMHTLTGQAVTMS